jgi:hypothetical protein
MMSWNKIGTQSSHSGNRPMIEGFTPKTTVEANMADRDVFGERIQRDRLPSGLPPMFGILLAVMWWPRGYFWWSSSSPTKGRLPRIGTHQAPRRRPANRQPVPTIIKCAYGSSHNKGLRQPMGGKLPDATPKGGASDSTAWNVVSGKRVL